MIEEMGIRAKLLASLGLGAAALAAPGGAAAQDPASEVSAVVVSGYAPPPLSQPVLTLLVLDTPQSVTVVTDRLLAEQGRRTLRDSMRNVTGISFQAGEGNPPGGGDSFSVRGFSARDDIYVDGIRDPGNYFRDPFYADRIEVFKGPASAIAGRGNVGGSVNIVTRSPLLENVQSGDVSVGAPSLFRATADVNHVLSQTAGAALRLNLMGHSGEEPGRDHVENRRWAVAPSLALGLDTDTVVTASYLHLEQDDVPDMGIPNARNLSLAGSGLAGRPAPVNRSNFYGYSTDYRDVVTDIGTVRIDHAFSDNLVVRNQTRYARVHNDQVASAPRFVGAVTTLDGATQAVGNRKPRDQRDTLLINQTSLTWSFGGETRHTFVGGLEVVRESSHNRRRLDANGPGMNLFSPTLQAAPPIPYNGTRAQLDVDTVSGYLFDTVEFGDRFFVVGGLRYDDVDTRVRGFDDRGIAPGFVTDLSANDREWSGNLGFTFKPTANSSLYAAYGTAFEPSGRAEVVQLAGGANSPPVTAANFNVDPERARSFEVGGRLAAMDGDLLLSAALFQIERHNARTPGVNPGDPAVVLEGEQRSRGIELQGQGYLTSRLEVFAGYTYLDAEVTRSNIPFEVGQRLDHAPRHSGVLWVGFDATDWLTLGGGVQHVGERRSEVRPSATSNITIVSDAYTVVDAFAEYRLSDGARLRLNLYNLGDERYFQSFASGQSIPSASRSAVLTLAVVR